MQAYYSLAAHSLDRATLSRSMAHGCPTAIPAVVIGRFALSEALHGKGLGGELLADALHRVVAATQLVAARFVVVDAVDARAMAFYEHFGFRRIPDAMRLVRKMSAVAADLQA